MKRSDALTIAKSYATKVGIGWVAVRRTRRECPWWHFETHSWTIEIDTGDGHAIAGISHRYDNVSGVCRFEYYPDSKNAFVLPLWVAYPAYNLVTSGWRQSSGEVYKIRWHSWYRELDEATKAEYKRLFVPPDDDRSWQDFYEQIADIPSSGSIIDHIINRV